MSTPGTEIGKNQEMPPQIPGSFHTQETVQQEKGFPQLPPPSTRNRWFVVATLGVALVLILSIGAVIIAQWGQHSGGQVQPTPTAPRTTAFHGGAQEGALAFYRYSQADGAIATVVMVKVLIKA